MLSSNMNGASQSNFCEGLISVTPAGERSDSETDICYFNWSLSFILKGTSVVLVDKTFLLPF